MNQKPFAISENDPNDDIHEDIFAKRGCCFLPPCLGSFQPSAAGSVWWQRIGTVERREADERWWVRGWRKLREWSELVAGPKWKTFIRRIGRNPNCCCGGPARPDQGKYRYDPLSYALNFDEGHNGNFGDGCPYRDFSSRYVLPPSTKSSMDFDSEKDAPILK